MSCISKLRLVGDCGVKLLVVFPHLNYVTTDYLPEFLHPHRAEIVADNLQGLHICTCIWPAYPTLNKSQFCSSIYSRWRRGSVSGYPVFSLTRILSLAGQILLYTGINSTCKNCFYHTKCIQCRHVRYTSAFKGLLHKPNKKGLTTKILDRYSALVDTSNLKSQVIMKGEKMSASFSFVKWWQGDMR